MNGPKTLVAHYSIAVRNVLLGWWMVDWFGWLVDQRFFTIVLYHRRLVSGYPSTDQPLNQPTRLPCGPARHHLAHRPPHTCEVRPRARQPFGLVVASRLFQCGIHACIRAHNLMRILAFGVQCLPSTRVNASLRPPAPPAPLPQYILQSRYLQRRVEQSGW